MSRVIHFELPADNPERAIKFYESVFGWQFKKWDGPTEYWMIATGTAGPGINGGLLRRPQPGAGPVNTVDVSSVDSAILDIEKHGGKTVVPKFTVPGVGYLAYCIDPENNMFGILQQDAAAK